MPSGATQEDAGRGGSELQFSDYPPAIPQATVCVDCEKFAVDTRVTGYDLCTDCAVKAIIQQINETNDEKWLEIHIKDLARLGWVAI